MTYLYIIFKLFGSKKWSLFYLHPVYTKKNLRKTCEKVDLSFLKSRLFYELRGSRYTKFICENLSNERLSCRNPKKKYVFCCVRPKNFCKTGIPHFRQLFRRFFWNFYSHFRQVLRFFFQKKVDFFENLPVENSKKFKKNPQVFKKVDFFAGFFSCRPGVKKKILL